MVKILQIIFFSLLITMMNGCSRPKKKTETTFKLTGSSLVNGTQMQGGIFLWAKPVDPQFPDFKAVLDADDTALIPFGEYNLHIVGYEGPNAWSGNTQCGGTPGPTIIEGPEVTITINLTTAACDAQPYIDMIAEIANGGTTTTPASTDMITVWQTTIANETITLPLTNTGTYNFTVDWGDGTPIQTITTWNQAETTHTYVAAGTYTVTMSGTATEWRSFLAASASKLIQVQNLGDMGWTNLSSAFDGCSNLTSFAGGKTNLVTTMLNMFKNTSSLTSLDLSSFDTSNVTIMEGMFRGASSLTSLDLSSFNTSNVTTMASMFSGASSLTSLDLSSFNTSNVTTMTAMFSGASSLTSLDLSSFDTSSVTIMNFMFDGASSLTSLDLSNFNNSAAISLWGMFKNTSSLTSLVLSSFGTSNVTNMAEMFSGASSLTSLDLSSFNTLNVTNMNNMFSGASSLTSLDLSSFNTSNVTTMTAMFSGASSLTSLDLSSFDTSSVTIMNFMFDGASSLTSLDLSSFDTSFVTMMNSMFANTANLTKLDTNGWNLTSAGGSTGVFTGANANLIVQCDQGGAGFGTFFGQECYSPMVSTWQTTTASETITLPLNVTGTYDFVVDWGDGSPVGVVTSDSDPDATHMYASPGTYTVTMTGLATRWGFNNLGDKDKIISVVDLGNMGWTHLGGAFKGCTNLTTFAGGNTSQVVEMFNFFDGATSLTSADVSTFDTTNVTNMLSMFRNASSLTTLDLSNFNTSAVTTFNLMFSGATALTSLNMTGWDTSAVTDFGNMFQNTNALTSLDVTGFDTSSATSMMGMFSNMASLTALDVSTFVTSSVVNFASMFKFMPLITTLDVSGFDTSSATNFTTMFQGNTALATLDVSTWDTSSGTSFQNMFEANSSLSVLDVSGWDMTSATNLQMMFANMSAVTTLDVSAWNTASVGNMANMFKGTSSVTNLDLSAWNTSSATNMFGMFDSSGVTKLILPNFNTTSVTNMTSMFANLNLTHLNVMNWDISSAGASTNVFLGSSVAEVLCDQGGAIGTGTFFGQTCTNGCPLDYARIKKNLALGVNNDFCVMVTEAKNDGGGNSISGPSGTPWTSINQATAKSNCQSIGANYDLISNPEWMAIVRDAEQVGLNWSTGTPGSGLLPRGWAAATLDDGFQNTQPPPSADNTCLYNSGANSCGSTGTHTYRRTIQTSWGEDLWDINGGVREWTDWTLGGTLASGPVNCAGGIYELNAVPGCGVVADDYAPINNITSVHNAGKFDGGTGGGALRGGSYADGLKAGMYRLNLSAGSAAATTDIGYRCVFRPPPP